MASITSETLFSYCTTLYNALDEDAKDGIWTGAVVKLFGGLGISNTHYSRVFDTLSELGCIERLQRGARGVESKIRLVRPPAEADFEGWTPTQSLLTRPTALDKLSHRVSLLEGRLEGIEIKAYIVATEKRLQTLEAQLSKAKRERKS